MKKRRISFWQSSNRALEIRVAVCVFFLAAASLKAQTDEVAPEEFFGRQTRSTDVSRTPQPEASGSLPYSQVFRDTDTPFMFRDLNPAPSALQAKFGQASASVHTRFFNNNLSFGMLRGFDPAQAELKIGNFYIDFRSLSGSVLVSDNVKATPANHELGSISVVRLELAAMYQVNESLRLGVAGALIYLPFRSEFGVEGFGQALDPTAQFGLRPLAQAQLTYDVLAGDWDAQFYDDFRVAPIPFGARLSYSFFSGEGFDEEDRAGRYVYGGRGGGGRTLDERSTFTSFDSGLIQGRNVVGAKLGRMIPTETRVEIGASHSEYIYLNGEEGLARLPLSQDQAYISLVNQRENLRFKPFADYRVSRYNYNDKWDQQADVGIHGPITDCINLYSSFGYYRLGDSGNENFTATVRLEHQINPIMQQSFQYARRLTDPFRALEESYAYRFNQIIADGLVGTFYGIYSTYEDLEGFGSSTEEWRAGLQFTYIFSPKTTFRAGATYSDIDYLNPRLFHSGQWVARAEMFYKFTPTFEAQLRYQYTDRFSDRYVDTYRENLGVFTLIKYF